ncbi:hypothetical protein WKW80_05205 [Variovorax humicola]|uniref:Uncharacterized protein n=1 Tax=Variovorax humicola TaxID=1769758 RepID=A0ABU8VUE6_9BURK
MQRGAEHRAAELRRLLRRQRALADYCAAHPPVTAFDRHVQATWIGAFEQRLAALTPKHERKQWQRIAM